VFPIILLGSEGDSYKEAAITTQEEECSLLYFLGGKGYRYKEEDLQYSVDAPPLYSASAT
jgi:hypothetical protein